jgi:hypothetical protein
VIDKVPSIGGGRGVFEIFVPGLFLLLNMWAALYLLPATDESTRRYLQTLVSRPALGVLVIIPFGYLAGVVLRLFRTDLPDRHSAWFQRVFRTRGTKSETTLWAHEPFPYPGWLSYLVRERFPEDAGRFFSFLWQTHLHASDPQEGRKRKQFVNFCKVVVCSADPAAAAEVYSAESFSRYISGMYYALCLALLMLATSAVMRSFAGVPVGLGLVVLLASYAVGILAILANFRFIRIKEIETIFAATYKNREFFVPTQEIRSGDTTV